MRNLRSVLSLVGVFTALVVSAFALAQGPGDGLLNERGPLLAMQPLAELQNEAIQDELKMSTEQRSEVRTIGARLAVELKEKVAHAKRRPLSANPARLRKEAASMLQRATDEALAKLTAGQVRRLTEVSIQIGGSLASANSLVQPSLKLSGKQKDEIQAEIKSLRQSARSERKAPSEDDIRRTQRRIDTILTDEQRSTLKAMAGESFRLPTDGLRELTPA